MSYDPKYFHNFFEENEFKELLKFTEEIFNSSKFGSEQNLKYRYVIKLDKTAGKRYCQMLPEMLPESILKKITEYGKNINSNLIFSHVNITTYSGEYGTPGLPPHFDRPSKVEFLLDYQLKSTIDWPLMIEGVEYKMENNTALLLENSKKVHWRNPIKFEKNDNVTVMFFSFENPFAELSNQEGHTEAIKKYYPMYAKKMEEFGQETGILLKAMEMYEASEKGLY